MHNSSQSFWRFLVSFFTKPKLHKIEETPAEVNKFDARRRIGIDRSKYKSELDYQQDLVLYNTTIQKEDAINLRDAIREASKQIDEINKIATRVGKKAQYLTKEIDKSLRKQAFNSLDC